LKGKGETVERRENSTFFEVQKIPSTKEPQKFTENQEKGKGFTKDSG